MNFFESLPASTRQLVLLWGPGVLQLLGKLLYAIAIFLIGRWLARRLQELSKTVLVGAGVDQALGDFLSSLLRYVVLAATVIAALEKLDVKTASLLAVFASAGLAVGLALQGSLSNFAAGTMILFFRPFTKGDRIEVSGRQGAVDEIGIFTTRLVSDENETIIIPPQVYLTDQNKLSLRVAVPAAQHETAQAELRRTLFLRTQEFRAAKNRSHQEE